MFRSAAAAFLFLFFLTFGHFLAIIPGGVRFPSPGGIVTTATATPTRSTATATVTRGQAATVTATPIVERTATPSATQTGTNNLVVRQTNLVSDVPGQARF